MVAGSLGEGVAQAHAPSTDDHEARALRPRLLQKGACLRLCQASPSLPAVARLLHEQGCIAAACG